MQVELDADGRKEISRQKEISVLLGRISTRSASDAIIMVFLIGVKCNDVNNQYYINNKEQPELARMISWGSRLQR